MVLLPVPEQPDQVDEGEDGQGDREQDFGDAQQGPGHLAASGGLEAAQLQRNKTHWDVNDQRSD